MNRSPDPIEIVAANASAVNYHIGSKTRSLTRYAVARALADIADLPEGEIQIARCWLNESDLVELRNAMDKATIRTDQPHVFTERDDDGTIRCAACHHLPAHCQGAAS